ncbi:hypothetical protein H8E50_01305 [bacterium]|nr:hypothetical protein [bacterium]
MSLSKLEYLRGLQCYKNLWLYKHELINVDAETEHAVPGTEKKITMLARDLFPGGEATGNGETTFDQRIQRTHELIAIGTKTIYDAAFAYYNVRVLVDILHRGEEGWELYEVKDSTSVMDVYRDEISLLYYVVTGSGIDITKACLMHLKNEYVENGDEDSEAFFAIVDYIDEAIANKKKVKVNVTGQHAMLQFAEPKSLIGAHCSEPCPCEYKDKCSSVIT